MAQEPESERNASGIARTSKRKWGYDSEQVDAFLERAHMLYEGDNILQPVPKQAPSARQQNCFLPRSQM